MSIPEEAVEAGWEQARQDADGYPYPEKEEIRRILEAAAPSLQREAWLLGHAAGRDYQGDGWNSDAHDPALDNPYAKGQAYIVECEDLGPGDKIWYPNLFELEQDCGPFPSCCVPKPVGPDYDGPKWVPE
jgi:hypothetical protein